MICGIKPVEVLIGKLFRAISVGFIKTLASADESPPEGEIKENLLTAA